MDDTLPSCMVCAHHKVLSDPDYDDWFCHDDVKVFCEQAKRNVTVACRPYNTIKETSPTPEWCPLIQLEEIDVSMMECSEEEGKPLSDPETHGFLWDDIQRMVFKYADNSVNVGEVTNLTNEIHHMITKKLG